MAAVLAAATGCGSDGNAENGGSRASGAPGTAGPASTRASSGTDRASGSSGAAGTSGIGSGGTLSQDRLRRAALSAADLSAGWEITKNYRKAPDGTEVPPEIVDVRTVPRRSSAACEPLYGIALGPGSMTRQHSAIYQEYIEDKGDTVAVVTLLSYRPADARGVFTDLRASVGACHSFPDGGDGHFADPRLRTVPSVGDEALTVDLSEIVESTGVDGKPDGGKPVTAPVRFLVVRVGATVAVFFVMGSAGEHPVIPSNVVAAQIAKLVKAG